jgi:hypothetical protein
VPKADKAPSPAELAKREDVFRIYRDMGPERQLSAAAGRLQAQIRRDRDPDVLELGEGA